MKKFRKIVGLMCLIIKTALVFTLVFFIYDLMQGLGYSKCNMILTMITLFIASVIYSVVLYSLSFFSFFIFRKGKDKNKRQRKGNNTKKSNNSLFRKTIIGGIVAFVVIESFVLFFGGWINAVCLSEFKLLESLSTDTVYAVVYETSDSFFIAECEVNYTEETISFMDIATKKEIDKKGVEYSVRKLKQEKD